MQIPYSSRLPLVVLLLLVFNISRGQTTLEVDGYLDTDLAFGAYFAETSDTSLDCSDAQAGALHFLPASQFRITRNDYALFLRIPLHCSTPDGVDIAVTFTELTYVDYLLTQDGTPLQQGKTGKFRPRNELANGDTRSRFSLHIPFGHSFLHIKVRHIKGYKPLLAFRARPQDVVLQKESTFRNLDFLLTGAILFLFLYILVSWLVTRFRPYLWLLIFITGIGWYGLSMNGYLIAWCFPNDPATGWLLNIHLGHLGQIGVLLLVMDFWQLKGRHSRLFRFGSGVVIGTIVLSFASFLINFFLGNYRLMNDINLLAFPAPLLFLTCSLFIMWRKMDRAQKLLGIGVFCFVFGGVFMTLLAIFMREASIAYMPYLSSGVTVMVALLLVTGLKERLRLLEVEKKEAMESLAAFRTEQNVVLEEKVHERTRQLESFNQELEEQKAVLAESNKRISLLMYELSHRVKNNLQMLYSLNSLQLPTITTEKTKEFIKGNMARIKAMMVVNKQLVQSDSRQTTPALQMVEELVSHILGIYQQKYLILAEIDIPEDMHWPAETTLPVGLILTELITNSLKHAFPGNGKGRISVSARYTDHVNEIELKYSDSGKGIDTSPGQAHGMGTVLVRDLAAQLGASFDVNGEGGAHYTFRFRVRPELSGDGELNS